MTGRVLVVDDILANLKLLEARLSAEYFEVLAAESGVEALAILERERIDVVVLDVMMPGVNGFEVCRRIKNLPATQHVPVILVTALDQPSDRIEGLEAGADDFLSKPVDDIALVTRVRNLARLKTLNDEMAMRVASGANLGVLPAAALAADRKGGGRILVVEDDPKIAHRVTSALESEHEVLLVAEPAQASARMAEEDLDLLVVSLDLGGMDGLRLCSQIRAAGKTRHVPIVVIAKPGDEARLLRGLDMGVNDYVNRPVDKSELLARVRTQLKRKRYQDHLRTTLDESLELAITDPLTGLHNRRYMETHLGTLLARAGAADRPLSLMIADVDHFKAINDTHGHDAGDAVLRELGRRLRRDTREMDLVCRLGGEELVVIMPDAPPDVAAAIAERVRASIADEPFVLADGRAITVTLSLGLATRAAGDTQGSLIKRADTALYSAKHGGRNRVVLQAA